MKVAFVTLREGSTYNAWVVNDCPYCGNMHEHFAGRKDENPRGYLGYRSFPCYFKQEESEGYWLVEDPETTVEADQGWDK